ncbi:MAG: hypothetical protein LBO74_10310 [Candidatus Symbiothrix sp.]|jgi:hypothetical protein|nr:hypothetical protein [Candidatus Symbiothrix sp.]
MKKITQTLLVAMLIPHVSYAQGLPEPTVFHSSVIEQSKNYVQGNSYQKDFLLFIEILRTTHPAFSDMQTYPIHLDSIAQEGYYSLSACETFDKFKLAIQSVASKLRDGHTFISPPDFSVTEIYPLNMEVMNGKFYINAIDKLYESVLGEEIETINEVAMPEIVNVFSKYISYDNELELQQRVATYLLFPMMMQQCFPNSADKLLTIKCKSGKEAFIQAKLQKDINPVQMNSPKSKNAITAYNQQLFSYEILDKEPICYLQFNTCFDYNTAKFQIETSLEETADTDKIAALEAKIAQYPKFDEFLAKMFAEIKGKNIPVLVVDVRHNGGGNSMLCDQLLSYLYPIDSLKKGNASIRISELLKQQSPTLYKEYEEQLAKQNKSIVMGKLYTDNDFLIEDNKSGLFQKHFLLNEDSSKFFTGKTIFIQSERTYSSAGDLIIWSRDNKIGSIVGEKSSYRPCNYGDILMWKLPNTELKGGVSHKYFTRPDTTKCGEDSLSPDVLISPTFEEVQQGIDSCWNWILSNY